jgi:hypothetical protein
MVSLTRTGMETLLRLENRVEPWLAVLTSGRSHPSIDDRRADRSAREPATRSSGSAPQTRESLLRTRASLLLHGPRHASLRERRKSRETLGSQHFRVSFIKKLLRRSDYLAELSNKN